MGVPGHCASQRIRLSPSRGALLFACWHPQSCYATGVHRGIRVRPRSLIPYIVRNSRKTMIHMHEGRVSMRQHHLTPEPSAATGTAHSCKPPSSLVLTTLKPVAPPSSHTNNRDSATAFRLPRQHLMYGCANWVHVLVMQWRLGGVFCMPAEMGSPMLVHGVTEFSRGQY